MCSTGTELGIGMQTCVCLLRFMCLFYDFVSFVPFSVCLLVSLSVSLFDSLFACVFIWLFVSFMFCTPSHRALSEVSADADAFAIAVCRCLPELCPLRQSRAVCQMRLYDNGEGSSSRVRGRGRGRVKGIGREWWRGMFVLLACLVLSCDEHWAPLSPSSREYIIVCKCKQTVLSHAMHKLWFWC